MDIDLNLDNYELQDLLTLFKLENNFNINDLKNAKKIVLQLHPDKSGLDKEYFLFYSKAFRIIKSIYDFRNKKTESLNMNNSKIKYSAENEDDDGKQLLVENLLKKDKINFNKWFNETFDKINIIDEERKIGYGDWFKSDDDLDILSGKISLTMMHQKIGEKKQVMSSIVKKDDIRETCYSSGYTELGGNAPESYGSDIFSKLQYDDLKVAHTETVVPVCDNDYKNTMKFNNAEALRNYRNTQNMRPMTDTESNLYKNNKTKIEDEKDVKLAYRLAKQDEEIENANKEWWANLRLLK